MANCPKNIFITGANRGLGLEMVKQLLLKYKPENIFACSRDIPSAKKLQELSNENPAVKLIKLDVRDVNRFKEVGEYIDQITKGKGINLLINNAGIFREENQNLQDVSKEMMLEFLEVNTFGALFLAQEFEFLLEKASYSAELGVPPGVGRAVIVNFTSRLGSIVENGSGGRYASRCSRAATNAITKSIGIDLFKRSKILAICMNPGWVQTDQGGPNAPLTADESVQGILKVIDNLNESQNGRFLHYDGSEIPW